MDRAVAIDKDKCIGCESCVGLCPEVFAFNPVEEKTHVMLPEGGNEELIDEAIAYCPGECIYWENY